MRRLLSVLFLLLLLGAGGTVLKAWLDFKNPGPLVTQTDVVIPHGDYLSTIRTLQQAGVLHSGFWTEKLCLAAVLLTRKDGQLHAAELHFPAFVSMQDALHIVRHGRPVLHKLTIPEGLTAHQIQALLQSAPFLEGDAPLPPEGSVMPETYGYLRNTDRKALLDRTQTAMTKAVLTVWNKRAPISEIPDEQTFVTLASLVEKETALPAERPLVARVFINRLQQGMKLQTDPTVIYALTNGAPPLGRSLTHTDLQVSSPYNTYMVTGLPPGPICSPGLSSLEAVAHPADGPMLYFVANGQGGHSFATSLTEHNKNVQVFRQKKQAEHAQTPQH
ncbi:endolytic transglycosylase MltG [Acetobacter orleanensis]|uniref:Endolytic murein transglycosylase n=1 Tax=Acetobacter orleanensis TaxID=104099 RepID=A0A4Y3TIN8_9PROT|nr:endolytic transglycosylase MltG [Acetobacter orleanensis]KXV63076.1 aminodeoxychorismate lyase [Acetobacter orleanensis]PCD80300.1 aminodeoxychorismate lyase [Acetobacter orleanensis]GAN68954.1 aminodeoxychorismate lyase [Acetobacter orleanensis JCM 7639]GBR30621.1 aminodeoxychorismate lyase [Acetobacter orleanensis NRIC 0473]GEB81638.1 4-amino-4-deoxychorismate lyase [Acetobacter orleanensis]